MPLGKTDQNWQIANRLSFNDTRKKILEFGWDLLPHPPYSPDLAPSDYYLFRSLRNSLDGKKFDNDANVRLYLDHFFTSRYQKFYERGIMMLPEKWHKVIDNNEQYSIA